MAAVVTIPDMLAGVAVPYELEADLSASTLGQYGPLAGYPEPVEDASGRRPALALSATGSQTAGTTIHVATQNPGNVGNAAARWRHTINGVTDTYWRGADLPSVLVGFAVPGWDAALDQSEPHALTLPDDTQAIVYVTTSTSKLVHCRVWSPSTETYAAAVVVVTGLDTSHSVSPALCLIADPGGGDSPILLCAYWVADDTNNEAQINIKASRDGGATWAVWASNVLPESITLNAGDYFDLHRFRMAYINGQIVLLMHLSDTGSGSNFPEIIRQYASANLGATFSLVGTLQGDGVTNNTVAVGFPDVVTVGAVCYAAYAAQVVTSKIIVVKEIGNPWVLLTWPYEPTAVAGTDWLFPDIDDAFTVGVGPPYTITFCAMSITARPDGQIVGVLIRPDGNKRLGISSIFNPATGVITDLTGTAIQRLWWYDSNDPSTEYPDVLAATAYRGQIRVYAMMTSNLATFEDRLTRFDLGGCSTVTMPSRYSTGSDVATAWAYTSIPTDTADAYGWTLTSSGGTNSVTAEEGWETITTVGAANWYGRAPTATAAQQIWQLFRVQWVSGGGVGSRSIACGIRQASAGVGYDFEARLSDTQIRVFDVNGATTVATISMDTATTGVDILAAIAGDGSLSVWAREIGTDEDRAWTPICSNAALTDDAGGGGIVNLVKWGCLTTSSSVARWAVPGGNAGAALGAADLANGQTNPDDLRGQPYAYAGVYVGAGVAVGATNGPTAVNDAWTIYPDAERPIRYLLPAGSEDSAWYVRGGQRTSSVEEASSWWATATSGYVLAKFPDGANHYLPSLCALHVEGLNAGNPAVVAYDYDAAAFTTLGTLDNVITGLNYARASTTSPTLRVVVGSNSNTPYFRSGELKGSYWQFGSGDVRPILDNTEGKFSNEQDAALCILTLGGIDGTEPTSGATGKVIYSRATFIFANSTTVEYGKFGLYWSSPPDIYEAQIRCKIMSVCSLEPLLYAEDWGNALRVLDPGVLYESRGGLRRGRKVLIAPRRTMTVPLTALWSQRPIVIPGTQTPIGYKSYNHPSFPLGGIYGDEFGKLLGAWRRSGGSQNPVVWINRLVTSAQTQTLVGAAAGFYARVTSPPQMTDDFGRTTSAGFAPVWRGDNWTFEEEI